MAYRGNLRRRMERANRIGARFAVFVPAEAAGIVQLKDLDSGAQHDLPRDEVLARMRHEYRREA